MNLVTSHTKEIIHSDEMKGSLEVLIIRESTGEVVQQFSGDNLVVNGGRSGMAHLWAGQWFSSTPIGYVNTMKWGDAGHEPSSPSDPKAILPSRSQLFCEDVSRAPIISKSVTVDFPDGPSGTKVRFTATIAASEGNGTGRQIYSEAGMYRVDGVLAAIKTFGVITKTAEFQLVFRWTFGF